MPSLDSAQLRAGYHWDAGRGVVDLGRADIVIPAHLLTFPSCLDHIQVLYSYSTVLFCTVPHCLPIAGVRVGGDGDHGAAADQAEVPGVASPGQGAQTPPAAGTAFLDIISKISTISTQAGQQRWPQSLTRCQAACQASIQCKDPN